jgi:cell pole-organizing protein PopZ
MSNTAKVHEPTMEEILASIRRIIADDETAQPRSPLRAVRPVPAPAPEPEEAEDPYVASLGAAHDAPAVFPEDDEDDVLELTDPVAPAPSYTPPAAEEDFVAPEPAPVRPYMERPSKRDALADAGVPAEAGAAAAGEGLIARETSAAVASAFGSLNNTLLSRDPRTIEDMVQDLLRPMLKGWLDENLPDIVERMVRAEIERIARGTGR